MMRRTVPIAALAAVLLLADAPAALAHAHLVSSEPAANASGRAPAVLVLHFSERLEPDFTGIALIAIDGQVIPGVTGVDATDATTIDMRLPAKLANGRYRVMWHALALDGHKTSGSYSFAVTR